MEQLKPLSEFFNAIAGDPRISITHIGFYATLLQCWSENHYQNPIHVSSRDVMRLAKITATRTYHKIIRDLSSFGYIRYEPSFKRNRGSSVYILYG
jgi:hypothetical protein